MSCNQWYSVYAVCVPSQQYLQYSRDTYNYQVNRHLTPVCENVYVKSNWSMSNNQNFVYNVQ
jgi:hypothetical protein